MKNIIGHEKVKRTLKKQIEENKIGHAYLFVGKEGIGKKIMAIEFAKLLLHQDGELYHEPEYQIISPENDVIKVEQIRSFIEEVYLKPVYSKRKVMIIDDADKMNTNAQNALLKILEEPPIYATIILIVSHKEKMLKTILSRTIEIRFEDLTNEELKEIVGERIDYALARGSVSKALAIAKGNNEKIAKDLMIAFQEKDFLKLNQKMIQVRKEEEDIIKILELLKIMYHNNIEEEMYHKVKMIELLDNTIKSLKENANVDLTLDKMMIQICRSV